MIKHHITRYGENGKWYAVSWLQFNIFRWCFCFWEKRIEIEKPLPEQ